MLPLALADQTMGACSGRAWGGVAQEVGVQTDVVGDGLVERWEFSVREWEGAMALWALEGAELREKWEEAAGERAVAAWRRWSAQGWQ